MNKKAAVITISDKGSVGIREDTSGPSLVAILEENNWEVVYTSIIPDEKDKIEDELKKCADELNLALVLTTGGTGFSPRDITPEATKAVVDKETPGIPEVMRAESMKITPHGCLSRCAAGIRKSTLIVNLPGSKKASKENLMAVIGPIEHGVKMILSAGSADCAEHGVPTVKKKSPSMDEWLKEAKKSEEAKECGMFLVHNGTVRVTNKSYVRQGAEKKLVTKMNFSYDDEKVKKAVEYGKTLPGIHYVRAWLNEGTLEVGDDIMYVLVGGDIRPNVIDALQKVVGELKTHCVVEEEIYK